MTLPLQIGTAVQQLALRLQNELGTVIRLFTDVALGDPLFVSFLLVAVGGLVIAVASVLFGGLSILSLLGSFFRLAE